MGERVREPRGSWPARVCRHLTAPGHPIDGTLQSRPFAVFLSRPTMYCAIDFGTSNSAIAIPAATGGMRLVELEQGQRTMPTAVFYFVEGPETNGPPRAFGRAAIASYVEGIDGRLMRSMKSILGSTLVDQTTDVGGGRGVKYIDIIAGYLRHLKITAEPQAGAPIRQAGLGRPAFFVDDQPAPDRQAQAPLEFPARSVGFDEMHFQYEPIAT